MKPYVREFSRSIPYQRGLGQSCTQVRRSAVRSSVKFSHPYEPAPFHERNDDVDFGAICQQILSGICLGPKNAQYCIISAAYKSVM